MASSSQFSRAWKVLGAIVALLFFAFVILPEYIVEWLWMDALGFASVFWTMLGLQVGLFTVGFLVAGLFLGANLFYLIKQLPPLWASRWANEGEPPKMGDMVITRGRLKIAAGVFAGFIGLAYAGSFSTQWELFLRFINPESYGEVDPIYGHDISFYLLQLPYLELLQGAFVSLVFLTLFILVTTYFLMGEVEVQHGRLQVRPSVVKHICFNLALLLVGWAWGYYLDRYEIMLTGGGAVFGADYIDVNVMIPAFWVMIVASLGLAGIVAMNMQKYRFRLLAYGAGVYIFLMIVSLAVMPALVRQLVLLPNELTLEEEYLEHNIEFTRMGFGIDDVDVREYDVDRNLTMTDVQNNQEAIDNIRLWDPRLLLTTYRQLQEIRTYYQFYNVDIDRYMIDGEYRQVMVSPRELTQTLPGRVDSWQNRHLQYTHGYGAVMNLVAQTGEEGTPELILRDLPPRGSEDLEVDEPGIYYGQQTPTYNIVNTGAMELDYPAGDHNVYTRYEGQGGVQLSTFWHQLLFAWHFSDYNIVLSDYIEPVSRIQFNNRLQQRIEKVAPFLELDGDPYFVVGDRRQYWIQDAYTTARHYPYSEHHSHPNIGRVNYVRNSVKIVVDAYEGELDFYVMDEQDPILSVYRKTFPDLFRPMEEMTQTIRDHIRYPQDMFEMQLERYNRYHMQDTQVFYNNEDLWTRPIEHYGGQQIRMEPYFVLANMPGEDRLEFLLISPTTPEGRDNMIGWMAARSDFPDYGELVVYQLPKDRLIYGPNQVEARIDQDTEISRQLALWDQRGSRVIRGNMIVVPIERTFLYVEPVFLIAEGAEIPQLQRVIASHGERVSMQRTLHEALTEVLGTPVAALQDLEELPAGFPTDAMQTAELQEARDVMQRARQALRDEEFALFGEEFEELQRVLDREGEVEEPPPLDPEAEDELIDEPVEEPPPVEPGTQPDTEPQPDPDQR